MATKSACLGCIAVFLAFCVVSCGRQSGQKPYKETDGITLDADVPGTEVFLADRKLGTVPVTLSAKDLERLGVPNPRSDTNAVLNSDGFGETVFVAGTGKESERFMFAVPERVRSDYVALETPWGIRTRHDSGDCNPRESLRVHCAKTIRPDGLSLKLEALNPISSNRAPWNLRITLSNHGSQPFKGFRPSLMICRSPFSPRSPSLAPGGVKLRDEWATLNPGKSRQVEIAIDPPDTKGDYGLYVIFCLFKDATSDLLAGNGSCYSNTRLFSVK